MGEKTTLQCNQYPLDGCRHPSVASRASALHLSDPEKEKATHIEFAPVRLR